MLPMTELLELESAFSSQGRNATKWSDGKKTHKLPSSRIKMMATFFLVCICKFHSHGIGKIRIAKLLMISGGEVMKYPTCVALMHLQSGFDLSHQQFKGRQIRKLDTMDAMYHAMQIALMMLTQMVNFRTAKMRW